MYTLLAARGRAAALVLRLCAVRTDVPPVIGLLTVIASAVVALLLRSLLCNHPIRFAIDGTAYQMRADGSLCHADGSVIADADVLDQLGAAARHMVDGPLRRATSRA